MQNNQKVSQFSTAGMHRAGGFRSLASQNITIGCVEGLKPSTTWQAERNLRSSAVVSLPEDQAANNPPLETQYRLRLMPLFGPEYPGMRIRKDERSSTTPVTSAEMKRIYFTFLFSLLRRIGRLSAVRVQSESRYRMDTGELGHGQHTMSNHGKLIAHRHRRCLSHIYIYIYIYSLTLTDTGER